MITGRADPGGGPEHVFQLSRQLLTDCSVFIASPREKPYWDRFVGLVGEERVCEIPHRRFTWSALRRLTAWSKGRGIEIIHSHGRAAGFYGRLGANQLNRPSVHTQHGPMQVRSVLAPVHWLCDLVLSWRTDHLIAVSASEALSMRRQLFRSQGITTIRNGVRLPPARIDFGIIKKRPLRVVHVTRFVPQKNSMMVLGVMEELRRTGNLVDFHVDMVGDGPGRAELQNEAANRSLESHITFHGAKPSVEEFFLNAFCMLSTSRWEGLPLAVLEALALGLPVVASNTPGNNDVVSASVGRLFDLNHAAEAAAYLLELRDSPEMWRGLSEAAVDLVKTSFSVQRMAADTLALYKNEGSQ
jgi:glycosyltransferase involved in cell wall biosynthesis